MKRTLKLQFVSLFLSVVIVFCSIPAFAVPQEGSDFIPPTQITTNAEEGTEQQSAQPVLDDEEMIEEVHLRDAFSKHYRKSNGEYYAVIYPEPVHYFKDDAWEEVDNTLIYQPASQKYSASSYQFSADFASSATSEELITFSDGEYSISWGIRFLEEESDLVATASASLQSDSIASAISGTISAATAVVSAEASQTELGKAVSQISYQNVFQNAVSLRYSVAYGRVEEDIILSSAQDFTSYQLVFQTNGLTVSKQEDNQIYFLNADQEIIFKLAAPWMKDANASFSDAFEVSVLQKGSIAVVNYTPNAQWLQDEARVFPVLIDPSFTTRQYASNYEDTYVVEDEDANANRATSQTLVVGNQNGKKHAAYLKVLNLPSWVDWDTVTQFDLEFYVNSTSSPALSVSEVVEDWSATSITYANQPNTLLVETDLVGVANNSCSKYVVDLMGMWTYWMQEDISFDEHMHYDFYGFKIECTNQDDVAELCSSEYSDYTKRPIIKVSYSATPSEVFEDGAVYTFINSALNKYLVVDDSAANYSYVSTAQTVADTRRTFRLIADDDGNGFAICTMHTGNGYTKALNFDSERIYSSGDFRSITVDINTYPSSYYEIEQLWSIEFVTENTVRIVPYQNARYALTASGTSVYIDEYTGAANQLWRVESAGQTLRWDASNIKSTNSLTVAENRISVPYVACPAIDHNSSVAYSSSNPSVATITASTGAIDIKKAGITTITATVEDADEDFSYYTLTLYVTLPNGTYYFNNVSNSYRIDLSNGTTAENEQLQLWNSAAGDTTNRNQLYKIKHLGNGVYSIRSMVDNNMGWTRSGSNLVNTTVGYYDSNISTTEKWVIDSNANGYYIYNAAGNQYTVTAPSTVSNGTKIVLETYSATNTRQNWTIQETAWQHHGIDIKNNIDSVDAGSIVQLVASVYSTYTDLNGQDVSWNLSNNGGLASINTTSGILNAIYPGEIVISVSCQFGYDTISDSVTIDLLCTNELLFDAIEELYQYANEYAPTMSRAEKAYLVMSFIRSRIPQYSTFLWSVTAGDSSLYTEYIDYVNQMDSLLMELFCEDRYLYITDGLGNEIDFYHLIATLNGMLFVDVYPSFVSSLGKNMAGWAGDLQSLVPNVMTYLEDNNMSKNYDNIYERVQICLASETGSTFSSVDLYADIDAYCLYTLITNMEMESMGSYFDYHYTYNFEMRFTIFVSGMTYETVSNNVELYMDIPLVLGDLTWLSWYQKDAFVDSFADYIWNYAIAESEG